jgi:hypothetical protein
MLSEVHKIIKVSEKSLRNIYPGFYFVLLMSNPTDFLEGKESSKLLIFLIVSLIVGPILYTTYRVILELFDYLLVNYSLGRNRLVEDLAVHTNQEYGRGSFDELRDYFYYKFASCHMVILCSVIYFYSIIKFYPNSTTSVCDNFGVSLSFPVFTFFGGLINYVVLCSRQRRAYEIFDQPSA